MYDNEFFVVDMASCSTTGEVINSISLALETLDNSGKKIILKLNDAYFNQSQMLSIQSLITSYGCILDTVETTNEETMKVAENMNILVQKPIEKRVEEKYGEENEDFARFSSMENVVNDDIPFKDVDGLHFEADLDAIKKQQQEIDIKSDLQNIGIDASSDFETIDSQTTNLYDSRSTAQTLDAYAKFNESQRQEQNYTFTQDVLKDEPSSSEENQEDKQIDLIEQKEETALEEELTDAQKKSINVYKKAYSEVEEAGEQWEEVDFYETETNEPVISDSKNTTYINQTLRSGQIIESDGNVVIIGDCHPGSEIRAIGDITVWGVLSGIAHAGYKGNNEAKVRALKLNAIQIRIGDCYSRRPDDTNIPYVIKSSIFTPEEARVVDGEIMLYKINQN